MSERRLVIDTSVIISAFLQDNSPPRWILDAALRHHRVLFSDATFEELGSRLLLPKFDRYVDIAERMEFLDSLPTLGQSIEVTTVIDTCRDSKDNKFLELAVDGQADLIITGDEDLLILHPFQGVDILTPRDALDRI